MDIKKTQRTTFIFTIWTFFYFLWFRWFMLTNWDFNIFSASHWKEPFRQWWYEGWIIQGGYFWLFIISLFLFIPVWILGLCFFLSRNYSKYAEKLFWDSIYKKKTKKVQEQNKNVRLTKKKSYKEIRPKALSSMSQNISAVPTTNAPDMMDREPSASQDLFMEKKFPDLDATFSSRPLPDNFEGISPFAQTEVVSSEQVPNFDELDQVERLDENLPEIMGKSGAFVIEQPTVNQQTFDYLAIAKDQIFLVLTDAEKGDWLADEERFNDEDPLWFSETSHRVSPITILKNAQKALNDKGLSIQSHVILVKTDGNIINAEDMQDVWTQMNVLVARTAIGMPTELPSFTQVFPAQVSAPTDEEIQNVQNILNG